MQPGGFGERAVTPMGSGTKPQPTYTVATGAENTFIYFIFSVVFRECLSHFSGVHVYRSRPWLTGD